MKILKEQDNSLTSGISPEFFDELPLWSAPFGLRLLDQVELAKDISVLDIGSGTGFPLIELAMRLGNSCKIYGLDPWKEAVERIRDKIRHYGISNVEIFEAVAESIPLDDHSIDLITSNNGINNVSDLDKTLSECARVIKKDGQFVFTMNLENSMIEFYDIMQKTFVQINAIDAIQKMKEHIYSKRKPLDLIIQKLIKHGFSISSVIYHEFEYRFTDAATMFNHFFIRIAFLNSWKEIVPPEKQDEVFALIEAEINKIAEENGYFTLSIPFVVIDSCGI